MLDFFDEHTCRVCGCSEDDACWDEEANRPCHWAEPGLCSVCAKTVPPLGALEAGD